MCPLHDPLSVTTVALLFVYMKYFLPAYYVLLNDLGILQPSEPLKSQKTKHLSKPPNVNYDRTFNVFFQMFQWASFTLCCDGHLWPLFDNSAPHRVTVRNFLGSSGEALFIDGYFLFNSNKGVSMVTLLHTVITADKLPCICSFLSPQRSKVRGSQS